MAAKKYTKDEIIAFLMGETKVKNKKMRVGSEDVWTDQYNIALDNIILRIKQDL